MVYLLLKCSVPEHFMEAGHAILEVDTGFLNRLERLSLVSHLREATLEKVYSISIESYDPTWITFGDPAEIGRGDDLENELEEGFAFLEKEQYDCLYSGDCVPIDCVKMYITEEGVTWRGYHKHGGCYSWTETYVLRWNSFDELRNLLDNSGQ